MVVRNDAKRLKGGIYWNDDDRVYRYKQSDRKLSNKQLYRVVRQELKIAENKAEQLTNRFVNGNLSFEDWQRRLIERTRNTHINLLRLGRGGKDKTYAIHYLTVGRDLKDYHYKHFQDFALHIKLGDLTPKQIIHRSKLYVRSARVQFEYGRSTIEGEISAEVKALRKLGACGNHCPECIRYAGLGYVSLVDLILPTQQCSCKMNCCCSVEYSRSA